jgi:hypothetical protein
LLGVCNNTSHFQRIALEAKEIEMESRAEQLRQELFDRSEEIKMVKREVCVKLAHAGWIILLKI